MIGMLGKSMGLQVVNGALLSCTFGAAPSPMTVLPINTTMAGSMPAANIMDFVPMLNIMPFGVCMTPSNPMVAAATAAALGVLTPMPCIPMTVAPWIPTAPTVTIGSMPTLDSNSKCMCTWGGVVNVVVPGQFTDMLG